MKSMPIRKNRSYVVVDGMSDHYPCLLSVTLTEPKSNEYVTIEKRKLTDDAIFSTYFLVTGRLYVTWK